MMAAIVRKTPHGRRAYPIDRAEADALVASGRAIRHPTGLYEEKMLQPAEQPAIAPASTYQTKIEQPLARKRGRPPKIHSGE